MNAVCNFKLFYKQKSASQPKIKRNSYLWLFKPNQEKFAILKHYKLIKRVYYEWATINTILGINKLKPRGQRTHCQISTFQEMLM
jgi:hypothetical protein